MDSGTEGKKAGHQEPAGKAESTKIITPVGGGWGWGGGGGGVKRTSAIKADPFIGAFQLFIQKTVDYETSSRAKHKL